MCKAPKSSKEFENTVNMDEKGRIQVRFHFDAAYPVSCFLRFTNMFSGNNYGSRFIPRVNSEVLVSFIGVNGGVISLSASGFSAEANLDLSVFIIE